MRSTNLITAIALSIGTLFAASAPESGASKLEFGKAKKPSAVGKNQKHFTSVRKQKEKTQ